MSLRRLVAVVLTLVACGCARSGQVRLQSWPVRHFYYASENLQIVLPPAQVQPAMRALRAIDLGHSRDSSTNFAANLFYLHGPDAPFAQHRGKLFIPMPPADARTADGVTVFMSFYAGDPDAANQRLIAADRAVRSVAARFDAGGVTLTSVNLSW